MIFQFFALAKHFHFIENTFFSYVTNTQAYQQESEKVKTKSGTIDSWKQ